MIRITIRNCADVQIISVVGAFPPNAFPLAKRTIYSAENGVRTIMRMVMVMTVVIDMAMMMVTMVMTVMVMVMMQEPVVVTAHVCIATDDYKPIPGMDEWLESSQPSFSPLL